MDAIFHIGMHKTGSTAIQHVFSNLTMDHLRYAPTGRDLGHRGFGTTNHSGLLAAMFHEPAEDYHSFQRRGLSTAEVSEVRDTANRYFKEFAHGEGKCLFSAEYLSSVHGFNFEAFAEFAKSRFNQIQIIGYVRAPVSYMQSRLQQMLKAGRLPERMPEKLLNSRLLEPEFRKAFQRFDSAFGKKNVTLKPFQPDHLIDGDVIADFANLIGYSGLLSPAKEANTSLSQAATGLLLLQRTHGSGVHVGYADANAHNEVFIRMIRQVGGPKLSLGVDFSDQQLSRMKRYTGWMEERLGARIDDLDDPRPNSVITASELIETGVQNVTIWKDVLLKALDIPQLKPHHRLFRHSLLKAFLDGDTLIPHLYEKGHTPRQRDLRAAVTTKDENALKEDIIAAMELPHLSPTDRAIKLLEAGKLLAELSSPKQRRFP